MPNQNIKPAEMYGITRSQNENGKYMRWQVMLSRRGLLLHKSFYDLTWGGSEQALAAAKNFRDAMTQLVPPLTVREYAQNLRASNTTGFVGVYAMKNRSGMAWAARIQLPSGKHVTKTFSETKYGVKARDMAIQARQEMLNLLDETKTFTFSPGAIPEANAGEINSTLLRPPRVLTVRVQRMGVSDKTPNGKIYARVSDGVLPVIYKTFSANLYGEVGAFQRAMQAALKAVVELGGAAAAEFFMRDYVQKHKCLPKKGVGARIRLFNYPNPISANVPQRSSPQPKKGPRKNTLNNTSNAF